MPSPPSRLARSLAIRPGEGPLAARVAAVFALLEVARGFGEVGVDTLLLGRFGPTGLPGVLPFLFMALGGIGLLVALTYTAALGRVRRDRLFMAMLATAAVVIVALRIGMGMGQEAVLAVLWLAVYAVGLLAMTLYWTLAGAAFDARQAKRLFPLLTGAAIVGSFIGTLGAGPTAALLGVENLVVLEAGLLAVAAVVVGRVPIRAAASAAPARRPASVIADVRVGFDFVRGSPLMSLVAIVYVLLSILMFSVSFPFYVAASAAFDDDVVLASVLGALSAGVTATSLLVSVVVAPRIYARYGVTMGALLLPVVYLAGFSLWVVHFSFTTAALVRFAQQVTQRGVSNAAWSSLYNTVPGDRRAQVLAFVDGVPGQIGTILSGVLLLAAGRILAPDQVLWLGVGTAVIATGVALAIRRRYASSLLAALRSGAAEQVLEGGPGVGALLRDPSVERALLDAADAREPGVREISTTLLGRIGTPAAMRALVAATGDIDARVRAGALRALRAAEVRAGSHDGDGVAGGGIAAGLSDRAGHAAVGGGPASKAAPDGDQELDLDTLERDSDPAVRAAAIALRAGRGRPMPRELLADPAPEIRAAAVAILPDDDDRQAALLAALDDEAASVREAAAVALAGSDGVDPEAILAVLTGGSVRAQHAALSALARMDDRDDRIDPAVARWARQCLDRATTLQRARRAIDAGGPAASTAFLVAVLRARQRDLEDTALGALAVLGAPEVRGVIRRCLRADDPEIRAQAMEALDSLGDRALAGSLVVLLEGEDGRDPGSREDALATLASDDDVWIRTLATRCAEEDRGDADMGTTQRTLTDLDTMLLLRRVPLFEGLDPEDLQRVAATVEEGAWGDGEALMREGDLGEDMIVLVSGSVRVTRREADGTERELRRYDAGEHIGELAVLRERPRAATVVADGPVRGLIIGGVAMKSILRERPEAAMAMLATLAERIGSQ